MSYHLEIRSCLWSSASTLAEFERGDGLTKCCVSSVKVVIYTSFVFTYQGDAIHYKYLAMLAGSHISSCVWLLCVLFM